MKIAFIYSGGDLQYFGVTQFPTFSPFDYETTGLGGTESSLVLLSKRLVERKHDVVVYAPCNTTMNYYGVLWVPIKNLTKIVANLAIYVRTSDMVASVDHRVFAEQKWLWLHDWQINSEEIRKLVYDRILRYVVVNSKTHYQMVQSRMQLPPNIVWILSAGYDEVAYRNHLPKIAGRCIYCSIPGRGLEQLLEMWPEIRKRVPSSHLIVTSGYELWKLPQPIIQKLAAPYKKQIQNAEGAIYTGVLTKQKLIEYQLTSQLFLYPSTFLEMCCISALECMAAKTVLVTRAYGALNERVISDKTGILIDDDPQSTEFQNKFIEMTVHLLEDQNLCTQMADKALRLLAGHSYEDIAMEIETRYREG